MGEKLKETPDMLIFEDYDGRRFEISKDGYMLKRIGTNHTWTLSYIAARFDPCSLNLFFTALFEIILYLQDQDGNKLDGLNGKTFPLCVHHRK